MIIYDSPKVKVIFEPEIPCVTHIADGFIKGDDFRKPFVEGMNFFEANFKKYPEMGWLNDARRMNTVGPDDIKWLNKNVNDRAYQIGAKKVAFVLPENIFGKWAIRMYVEFTNRRSDNKLEIKAFKTIEDAKTWLKGGQVDSVSF